mgnify:CR=1 FL=1
MWKVDLTYREEFQTTFERLFDKKEMLVKARPLPSSALAKIREALTVEWTYNSNSIEGNTLTLQETQMIIQEGITVKGKSLREHFEAKNHELAIDYLYNLVTDNYVLRSIDMLSLHIMLCDQLKKILPED